MNARPVTRCTLVVLAALTFAVSAGAQSSPLALIGTTVIDVVKGQLTGNATVVISGGAITSVAPGGAPPAGATVMDGAGTFLIPGLWDMHAHMEMVGEPWLQLYVANGVTGLRDMGSDLDLILKMREATASGRVLGPRIFAAGPMLDDPPGDWPSRIRVKNAEEARASVRFLRQRDVDFIKVHNNTPRDVFFAAVDEARREGLPVAGHIPLKVSVEEGVDARLKSIEHFSEGRLNRFCSGGNEYRPEACRPLWERLARDGIWQTPTLMARLEAGTLGTPASTIGPEQLAFASQALRDQWAAVQKAFITPELVDVLKAEANTWAAATRDMERAGVGILAGCDGLIAGFCVHDELAMMVRGGMSPLAALQTATLNPARYFGLEQTAGTAAPGKRADLVLLDANPLTDIANVRRIRAVVAAGRFLDRAALDGLLEKAKAAAAQP